MVVWSVASSVIRRVRRLWNECETVRLVGNRFGPPGRNRTFSVLLVLMVNPSGPPPPFRMTARVRCSLPPSLSWACRSRRKLLMSRPSRCVVPSVRVLWVLRLRFPRLMLSVVLKRL